MSTTVVGGRESFDDLLSEFVEDESETVSQDQDLATAYHALKAAYAELEAENRRLRAQLEEREEVTAAEPG